MPPAEPAPYQPTVADIERRDAAARETTRRIADRCLDLGRELEALRAAVRAHEAATVTARAADLDLWAAAKA